MFDAELFWEPVSPGMIGIGVDLGIEGTTTKSEVSGDDSVLSSSTGFDALGTMTGLVDKNGCEKKSPKSSLSLGLLFRRECRRSVSSGDVPAGILNE